MVVPTELAEAFRILARQLHAQSGFSEEDLHGIVSEAVEARVPATLFALGLTPLEALTRHLEDRPDSLRKLGRPSSVLKQALRNSHAKHPEPLRPAPTEYAVPLSVFSGSEPALEELCGYLRSEFGLSNTEIAALIGRDPRTVWTVLDRASKRGGARG